MKRIETDINFEALLTTFTSVHGLLQQISQGDDFYPLEKNTIFSHSISAKAALPEVEAIIYSLTRLMDGVSNEA